MLEVPQNRSYNYCMMNEIEQTNYCISFVTAYGEMSAALNERYIDYDVKEELDKIYNDEYFKGMLKWDSMGEILDIFEEDFECPENEYKFLEVRAIKEWLDDKRSELLKA